MYSSSVLELKNQFQKLATLDDKGAGGGGGGGGGGGQHFPEF